MLAVTLVVLPAGFAWLVWHSYRDERRRVARGEEGYAPSGRVRWTAASPPEDGEESEER